MTEELNKIEEIKITTTDADLTGVDDPRTRKDTAFGWPLGTVRALIAMGIVFSTIVYLFLFQAIPPELNTLVGLVIGFYFSKSIS